MTWSASPTEVRIEHPVADQAALGRAFTALYALLAMGGVALALLVQPELLLGALFFAGFVAWWAWRVRRAQSTAQPWLLRLTPDELHHSSEGAELRIARSEAGSVGIVERAGPRMRLRVLTVRDREGEVLLEVSLPGRDEATMLEAAFEEWAWPVGT